MNDFYAIIGDVAIYLAAAIAIIYSVSFVRNNKAYRIFVIYLLLIALIQIGAYYVGRGKLHKSNLYYSHYYYITQFLLLSIFYLELLKWKWVKLISGLIVLFLIYQYIDDPSIYYKYNSIGMIITNIALVVYSIFYLYRTLSVKGEFIIANIGILIYLISSTLIFASGNLGLEFSQQTFYLLVNTNRVLYLVFLILILIEWYLNYRKGKPSPTSLSN